MNTVGNVDQRTVGKRPLAVEEIAKMSGRLNEPSPGRWWFESEFMIAIVLVAGAYFFRAGAVTLRGEEPRRYQIAFEMRLFNDWFTPREQGELLTSRPPLHNWMIAASEWFFSSNEPVFLRLPSLIAILLSCTLLYGYVRLYLCRSSAMMTALVFPTMGEMFQMGKQAETEAVYILFITASLLLWHWGYCRRWPAVLTWSAGYAGMALAGLCKGGVQPPLYFLGTAGLYLLFTRNLWFFFRPAHLGGLAVGVGVTSIWLVPFYLQNGSKPTICVWLGDTASRFCGWQFAEVAQHLGQFPLEVIGSTLPWSLLLGGYVRPSFLRWARAKHPETLFAGLAVLIAFPTCWIPPGGQTRYFAPLYPCVAVLIGYVIHSCFAADGPEAMRNGWRTFIMFMFVLMSMATIGVPFCALFLRGGEFDYWAAPTPAAAGYFAAFALFAWQVLRCRNGGGDERKVRAGVVGIVAFMMVLSVGYLTDLRVRRSEDTPGSMADLKKQLPPRTPMASLGPIDALFAYYFGQLIEAKPLPPSENELSPGEYFCFCFPGGQKPKLPFPWQEIKTISMDRNAGNAPERVVVVGRRMPIPKGDRSPASSGPLAIASVGAKTQ